MKIHPGIGESRCYAREILLADLHHPLVDFDQVQVPQMLVLYRLPHRAPVAAANNQHVLGMRMTIHGYVGYHLMVYVFVLVGQLQHPIKYQSPAPFNGLDHRQFLKRSGLLMQNTGDSPPYFIPICVSFVEPAILHETTSAAHNPGDSGTRLG